MQSLYRHASCALLVMLGISTVCRAVDASLTEIRSEADAIQSWLVNIRRELHQWPELMFNEYNTSAFIRRQLDELGVPYRCCTTVSPEVKANYAATLVFDWLSLHNTPASSGGRGLSHGRQGVEQFCSCNSSSMQLNTYLASLCAAHMSGTRWPRQASWPPSVRALLL